MAESDFALRRCCNVSAAHRAVLVDDPTMRFLAVLLFQLLPYRSLTNGILHPVGGRILQDLDEAGEGL